MNQQNMEIAQKMLDILPLVMRVMAGEIRAAGQSMNTDHAPIIGLLQLRPYTIKELAERLSVKTPTMSNMITTMEERGWVTRRRDEQDRRVVWIELTPAGASAQNAMMTHMIERIAGLLEGLPAKDQDHLIEALTVLREVFADALERDPALRERH
ncbi:MAG: MarR family transcriptional regulator [Anaerolineae bacterium]|jgi:DNA-binding MarR family transcriptional regulator|nr:MarR family transcriptional regulator [Anaerolineae bacterium]